MIDYHVLVQFLEENYGDFTNYCGSEEVANEMINELRKAGGMESYESD